MITIGYNQVQEKHVKGSSGNPSEAKKVYVGNKLAHVHVNDNTEFALRQTLNGYIHEDNDLYAKVRSIRGNTKVWNQLTKPFSTSNYNATGNFSISGDVLTIVGRDTGLSTLTYWEAQNINWSARRFIYGHKYYTSINCTNYSITIGAASRIRFIIGEAANKVGTYVFFNGVGRFANITTSDNNYETYVYGYANEATAETVAPADTFSVKDLILIDLTLIYGAGNEPTTVAEFEADFQQWFGRPIGAEPYDAGSLIPFLATGIKSIGFNLWDEEWELGIYNSDGAKVTTNTAIRSTNRIKVFPNTSYSVSCGQEYTSGLIVRFFRNSGVTSLTVRQDASTFTTPIDCYEIGFCTFVADNITTYNHDICINLSNPTLNGTYVPYKATTVPIPVTTLTGKQSGSTTSELIFPDGMKYAGSIKDEVYVEDGKTYAVKRVGSVDLGTLNWGYTTTITDNWRFGTNINNIRKADSIGDIGNLLCYKYKTISPNSTYTGIRGISNNKITTEVFICDISYTDATTFKAAMSGVMLYYELATPIVYEVDNYTLPLYYLANGTGTEEIVSTATSAPADMDIEYRLLEEEWYGIRWRMTDDAWVSPVRIGNPRLHQELPIQSMMKRCALVNGVPKFISESNVDEYEDGTAVDYANTDIYVQIPEYYFEATKDDDGWCELRIHTKAKIGTKSRLYYEGAWLATLDNNVLGSKSYIDFNAIGNPIDGTYNAALFKNATNFVANTPRGGNGITTYDDTEGCNIGRPKTSTTIADFRTYAHNNSNRHGIVNYDCWCSIMRLFMVEFCSFYSQAAIDDTLTVHKFRQGGLSAGVTSGLTNWNNFNGYNPLIPCGFTKSLGNRTGIINMHYAAEGAQTSAVNMSVPSYRGIEEPFGDIYNIVDGIAIYGDGANTQKASIYVATAATIDNNAYVTPSGTNAAPTGYELLTDDAPYKEASDSETSGYIKVWHWDEHGMFAPLKTGGDSTTIGLTDYMYMYNGTGWRLLLAGGNAHYGGYAGLGCFDGRYGFGHSSAGIGSRLLYTPAS